MTDFRPDCIINLHVEARGKPAKVAWSCSIQHAKRGQIVLARRFLGLVPKEEAELKAVLFGVRQAARLLQEKVEIRATFPLEGRLDSEAKPARLAPEWRPLREEAVRLWGSFRLTRVGRMGAEEAALLQGEAERSYRRGKS